MVSFAVGTLTFHAKHEAGGPGKTRCSLTRAERDSATHMLLKAIHTVMAGEYYGPSATHSRMPEFPDSARNGERIASVQDDSALALQS